MSRSCRIPHPESGTLEGFVRDVELWVGQTWPEKSIVRSVIEGPSTIGIYVYAEYETGKHFGRGRRNDFLKFTKEMTLKSCGMNPPDKQVSGVRNGMDFVAAYWKVNAKDFSAI